MSYELSRLRGCWEEHNQIARCAWDDDDGDDDDGTRVALYWMWWFQFGVVIAGEKKAQRQEHREEGRDEFQDLK